MKKYLSVGNFVKFDLNRPTRKGIPEIILAAGKREQDLFKLCQAVYKNTGEVIVSRISRESAEKLKPIGPYKYNEKARLLVIKKTRLKKKKSGSVGILTAGTADIPAAEEAKVVAEQLGCKVTSCYDVGVAGIQRLFPALTRIKRQNVDVLIVAAGREGALPSIVAGLVEVPVIGLPTSCGYGYGGQGTSALMSMLQSCSPGLTVVNIDNGVGAGLAAAIICRRCHQKRKNARGCV